MNPPVLPQAPEAEEHVLGALLLAGALGPEPSARAVGRVRATGLGPGDFLGGPDGRHGRIFRAIVALAERGEPTDVVLVCRELERHGHPDEDGRVHVTALARRIPTIANVAHHAALVVETAARRRELRAIQTAIEQVENGSFDEAARARLVEALTRSPENPFPGLTHEELLAAEAADERFPEKS